MLKESAKNSRVQNAASPMMFHPDLHKRNIFVSKEDPTVVSAIIDWESTSVEPLFWHADAIPNFAQPLCDPSDGDKIEPKSEACAKAYDVCIQFLAPELSVARSTEEAYFRPFCYCYRTWEDGAVAFREEFIQTSQLWKKLGFTVPSPFPLPILNVSMNSRVTRKNTSFLKRHTSRDIACRVCSIPHLTAGFLGKIGEELSLRIGKFLRRCCKKYWEMSSPMTVSRSEARLISETSGHSILKNEQQLETLANRRTSLLE
jgi:hypothetical protein